MHRHASADRTKYAVHPIPVSDIRALRTRGPGLMAAGWLAVGAGGACSGAAGMHGGASNSQRGSEQLALTCPGPAWQRRTLVTYRLPRLPLQVVLVSGVTLPPLHFHAGGVRELVGVLKQVRMPHYKAHSMHASLAP